MATVNITPITKMSSATEPDESSLKAKSKKPSTFKKIFKGIRKNGVMNAVAVPLSEHGEEEGEEVPLESSTCASSERSPIKPTLNKSEGEKTTIIRMDKYGFLLTDDRPSPTHHQSTSNNPDLRLHKWQEMLDRVPRSKSQAISFSNTQSKVKYYTRRGLPDGVRSRAWTVLTGVDVIMAERRGEYRGLVKRAEEEFERWRLGIEEDNRNVDRRTSEISALGDASISTAVMETIERDIHRTFPKHYLFHNGLDEEEMLENISRGGGNSSLGDSDAVEEDSDEEDDDDISHEIVFVEEMTHENRQEKKKLFDDMIGRSLSLGCGGLDSVENFVLSLPSGSLDKIDEGKGNDNASTKKALKSSLTGGTVTSGQTAVTEGQGAGQAALRRILRAYSVYDAEVGYCQGMNFIAAMFLTFLSEEEAFWLLVVVMNEEPYKLRELFGEDMAGTHEVLYIAEKLMHQFLPKLSQHLEKENIHISMFVTSWLLTVYTSIFPFDLVSRVWDCFLVEGWKVVYRVMLALMESGQKELLGLHFEEILNFFRDFPNTVDGSTIMSASLKIPLKRKHIQKHVTEWRKSNDDAEKLSKQSSAKGVMFSRRESVESIKSQEDESRGSGSRSSKGSLFRRMSVREISVEDLSGELLPIIGASKFAVLLHNVLTPEECSEIIDSAEEAGFQPAAIYDASTRKVHRNCTRRLVDDHTSAENWFERILQALDGTPFEHKVRSCPWIGNKHGAEPLYAVSLNERLRVIKYSEGQFYTKHLDVGFTRGKDAGDREGEKSLVSVHIYLNEKFRGGYTRFHGGGRWLDIDSKTGSVLLFDPTILHEATAVSKGDKYLVRSDIMYSSKPNFSEVAGTGLTTPNFSEVAGTGFTQQL